MTLMFEQLKGTSNKHEEEQESNTDVMLATVKSCGCVIIVGGLIFVN